MIVDFSVRNFRSIFDATLDFRYGEGKAPNGYQALGRLPFLAASGERVVPCLALFGANANGKSNLLKALIAFRQMANNPFVDVRGFFDPNLLNGKMDTTRLEIGFVSGRHNYRYALEYSGAGIVSESLGLGAKSLFSIDASGARFDFARDGAFGAKTVAELFKAECHDSEGAWIRPFLNMTGNRRAGMNKYLSEAFNVLTSGLVLLDTQPDAGEFPVAIDFLCRAKKCGRQDAIDEVVDVVRKLDIDLRGMSIVEKSDGDLRPQEFPGIIARNRFTKEEKHLFIQSLHRDSEGLPVWFNFMSQESTGTVRLATMIAYILCALHSGMPAIIDDLDRSLHPLLARAIVSLFTQRAKNSKNAQLVFSTHCTDLLDDEILRISEVGIVTKHSRLGTKVTRLCDFRKGGEDIRNVYNFRKSYLNGFYSGVPYPAL